MTRRHDRTHLVGSNTGRPRFDPVELSLDVDGVVASHPGGDTPASMAASGSPDQYLWIDVVTTSEHPSEQLPVLGTYVVTADSVRFTPHFPFEPGVRYRATFDARGRGCTSARQAQSIDFTIPFEAEDAPPEVARIYPTTDRLPENLLRFYIRFSRDMRRGDGADQISLVRPDGDPVPDALYRPPVELWDPSMRYLTVLIDPGRLKRLVGPNRALGPPLTAGQRYSLRVGPGMADETGRPLGHAVFKHFLVGDPLRASIAIEQWTITVPHAGTRDPLSITFPHPMDWVLMSQGLTVESRGRSIDGRISIAEGERHWCFTPRYTWANDDHRIAISADVEDVCGNGLHSPFDRPIRTVPNDGALGRSLHFSPA